MHEQRLAYRWPMAIWTLLVGLFVGGLCTSILPPLFTEIEQDLGLTHTQMGITWGITAAGTFLTALAGGVLGDRYGPKKVIAAGILLSVVFCALRALLASFWGLSLSMLLFGMALGLVLPNTAKAIGMWFARRELGTAMGIVFVGGALGSVIALMLGVPLSSALGGWKNVMWLSAAIALAMFIMWTALARERPLTRAESEAAPARPAMLDGLKRVMRVKDLWLICGMNLCMAGSVNGFLGHFPQNTADRGMSPGMAGVLTGIGAIMVIGFGVVGPRISDRVGLRKPLIWPVMLVSAAFATFLGIAWGAPLVVVVVLNGAAIGCVLPLLPAVIIENPSIGPLLAGAALGLLHMVDRIGGTLVPMAMGAIQDATGEYWQSYLLTAALCAVGAVLGFMVKETGIRAGKAARAAQAAGG
jgi:MFS family permease